jgi:hypothetical protein
MSCYAQMQPGTLSASGDCMNTHQPHASDDTPPNGVITPRAAGLRDLEEQFSTLEALVRRLTSTVAEGKQWRATVAPPRPPTEREVQLAAVSRMLTERGSVTVADVRSVLGVSVKTAGRLMHAIAHDGGGVLLFEPAGPTERLRLFHPDKVVIDR